MTDESRWKLANANRDTLLLATHVMAPEFAHYLDTEEGIDELINVCRDYGILRVYLETFRSNSLVPRDDVVHVRDRLREAGLEVAGAICTDRYGHPSDTMSSYPCLSHETTWKQLREIFTFNAKLFDLVLIDEYIWSHCQCAKCRKAKGDRTWTEFRCSQMQQVCRDHVIQPAREANADVKLIFKFPAMYEEFARQGQDVDLILEDFDAIWVGTETGPFPESPQNILRSQGPYRAFFLTSWLREMGKEKMIGAWMMPIEDADHFRDNFLQTMLAGLPEILLHPYGGVNPAYSWLFPGGDGQYASMLADLPELFKLAKIVKENPPRGLVAARPARAEPWEFGQAYDANVFDFIGQIGIPLRPTRNFPENAEGWFLSLHTRSLPDYDRKIEMLRHSDLPILLTNGLASTLDQEFLARPNVHTINASVHSPAVYDYRGFPDPYDIHFNRRPVPENKSWEALAQDTGWDISMRYTSDARMVANIFSIAPGPARVNPEAAIIPKAARKELKTSGPPVQDGPVTLESLRQELLRPFGFDLRGPIRVSLHPLGNRFIVLHNFNAHPVTMQLEFEKPTNLSITLILPTTSQVTLIPTDSGYSIDMESHTLACLKIAP